VRGTRVVAIVTTLVVALAVLLIVGRRSLERDRQKLYADYAADRTHRLERAAVGLAGDVDTIGEDLQLAATLVGRGTAPDEFRRELGAIATVTRPYLAFEVGDGRGQRIAMIEAAGTTAEMIAGAQPVLSETLALAVARPDTVVTSRPVTSTDEAASWYRVFARRSTREDNVVAVLVDMRPLLGKLRLLGDDTARVLVLGAGRPAPASDPILADAVRRRGDDRGEFPALAGLLASVEDRRGAHVVFGADEAARLGLPRELAVGVSVPVPIEDGEAWALVVVASTAALEAQGARLFRRVVTTGALATVLLVALSTYVLQNARRAAALRERLRQADRVAHLTEKLIHSEKLATAGQLAAGIAHELGTPLNIVRGRAELALGKLGDDHPHGKSQRIIIEQIDAMSQLISQLLDYVRPRPPHAEAFDLGDALRSIVELLAGEASKRKIALDVAVADDTPAAHGDLGHLRQVLVNLAMNALDASTTGGRVAITARPRPDAATLAIEITDDGHGIPADQRAQVFDPFFTTKKRGQGTGLGLWVVAQLVRANGGDLELSSEPGKGTTVRIDWPIAATATAVAMERSA
jgi:signal transduction histidine kinase